MTEDLLRRLGLAEVNSGACADSWIEDSGGSELVSINPATGEPLGRVVMATAKSYDRVVDHAIEIFATWHAVPRRFGVSWSVGSGWPCASTRPTWACWSRSRPARSAPRARARSRR